MLQKFIENELRNEYLKTILKKHSISTTNLRRGELLERFYKLKTDNTITDDLFWEYVATVFKYGNNRIILTSFVNINPTSDILMQESLERRLKNKSEPAGKYNKLIELTEKDRFLQDTLVYQDINVDSDQQVQSIERCYCRTDTVYRTDDKGETTSMLLYFFTWVNLDVSNRIITIHTRNPGVSHLHESRAINSVHEKFIQIFKDLFSLSTQNIVHQKRTLYNIYKEMTDTAEKPFREKVDTYKKDFEDFYNTMNSKLDYRTDIDSIKLLDRMIRLYERGLITQNEELYTQYHDGKYGIIQRIVFCDNTGANVSAKVKEIEQNISNYDIYFDTRDTLDEKKMLDKLWVVWYYTPIGKQTKRDYLVKFEIQDDFYVSHFIGPYLMEEVADYVFSKFREFEN